MIGTIRINGGAILLFDAAGDGSICTGTKDRPVSLPSGPTAAASASPTASPTTTPAPEQQVLDTYLGMMRTFNKAGQSANPDDPDLPKYATGAALTLLRNGLTSMRNEGLRSKGETIYNPKVESLTPPAAPSTARIRDCMDTRNAVAYKANGEPYQDTPGGYRLVIADAERIDGTWKVTGMGVHGGTACRNLDGRRHPGTEPTQPDGSGCRRRVGQGQLRSGSE
jgi:hypothetical protein